MNQTSYKKNALRFIALILIFLSTSCALTRDVVPHGFAFNMLRDEQDAEVLDYRYGESKLPVRASAEDVRAGKTSAANSVLGPMFRGDSLYVKWRNKYTQRVYEDTVDLRSRLPKDIKDHIVYFMIQGPQLYVYLIAPDRRPKDAPPIGPAMYQSRKITRIYPDLNNQ
jgi:hypothetical protein